MLRRKSRSRKPCKPDQVRDRSTGRCRKLKSPSKKLKVSASKRRKSSTRKSRSRKPCKSDQVRDRSTGRCRKHKSPSKRRESTPNHIP